MRAASGAFAKVAGTAGKMKSGCASAVGRAGGVRAAHPAASATTTKAANRLRIGRLSRSRQPFDEAARDVGFDDNTAVAGDVADHACHTIQPPDLLPVEF